MSTILLDLKLAVRILARYPLLTIVGGVGMAFGLAAAIVGLEVRTQMINPRLPLPDGARIVGVRNWDMRGDRSGSVSDTDFTSWRHQVGSIESLSAISIVERNLDVDGNIEPISVAETTASAFRVTRVPAMLGRTLVDDDEQAGAPPVAVIGQTLWQRRFQNDPLIVGRTIRLGAEPTTIVGVMPASFGFPVAHEVWTPLRLRASGNTREKSTLLVVGRLDPDVTIDQARVELTAVGQRMAIADPNGHGFLRPEVIPYASLIVDPRSFGIGLALANVFLIALIVVVAANVALLMFARAVSRETEIGVRTALGASRVRIVAQLFIEALALAALSATLGLAVARYGLASLWRLFEADSGRPVAFWLTNSLTPSTITYCVALTMLVAVVIGVLPALTITGRGLHSRMRSWSAGGGGYRFGGLWTAVIATQVAVTVMFPAAAFFFHRWVVQGQTRDAGFPAREYLSARVVVENGRGAALAQELRRRLAAEPEVTAVAIADWLPGMQQPGGRFELEGDDAPPTYGYDVRTASVDLDFFSALGVPVLSGRAFAPTDAASGQEIAIVNASFVERVLHGRSPVGRRIRLAASERDRSPGPWIEIVGLVRDLGVAGSNGIAVYRPLGTDYSTVHLMVHTAATPESFTHRLRAIAGQVDPTLRVHDVMTLDRVGAGGWLESQYLSRLLSALSGIALLLSLMAIYAVTSFTVVQRTREIGTRVALGADPRRLIAAIVRRPLVQISLGLGAGGALVVVLFVGMFDSAPTALEAGSIVLYATMMLCVCLSACVVPIARALRLEPSQVLRADS